VQTHTTHALVNRFGENRISVMNQYAVRVISWNGFTELLDGPLSGGTGRHIDMKQPSAGMLNHYKYIEDTKSRGNCHAEITCDNPLGVIANKGGPALR
jgi:hypothetical protein